MTALEGCLDSGATSVCDPRMTDRGAGATQRARRKPHDAVPPGIQAHHGKSSGHAVVPAI
jgi:hypothetical protein